MHKIQESQSRVVQKSSGFFFRFFFFFFLSRGLSIDRVFTTSTHQALHALNSVFRSRYIKILTRVRGFQDNCLYFALLILD